MRKKVSFLLAATVTVLALLYSFRNTDVRSLVQHIIDGRYIYVLPAFIGLMLYCYLRAVRWGFFFEKKLDHRLLWSVTMIGLMANNIFPARAGEFLKAYIMGKRASISKSACFATVVLERLWDGLILLFFIVGMFLWMVWGPEMVRMRAADLTVIKYAAFVSVFVYMSIIILVAVWAVNARKMTDAIHRIIARISPRGAVYLSDRLRAFNAGLGILRNWRSLVIITFYSFLIWIAAVFTLYFMFLTFSFTIPYTGAFVLIIMIALFVMIPSVGTLGTMQMAFVLGLGIYGIDKTEALSFSFVYQFFDTVPVVAIGLFYFLKGGLTLAEVNKIKEE